MIEQGRIIYRSPNHPDLRPRAEEPPAAVYMPPLEEPSHAELIVNVTQAGARWIAAGFPLVSDDVYAARTAACEACPLWDAAARRGLGKCNAPGCGCTKFKRWLATERCKHPEGSRWSA
jgi:hypothetical protein